MGSGVEHPQLNLTQAYPESLPTICARRAIHTGLRAWPFRNWHWYKGITVWRYGWQPIPEEQTTIAEMLKKKGYETLLVSDTQHQFQPSMNFQRGFGAFDFIRGQTTDAYRPIWTVPQEKQRTTLKAPAGDSGMRRYFANTADRSSEEDWFAPQVFARASKLLEIVSAGDRPFFLVVDSYDPHEPWDPPKKYVDLYDEESYAGREPYWPAEGSSIHLTERELKRMRALYAGEVTMVDRWLGNFLDRMDELNLFENTLLVVLADHGISHGEHHIVGKPFYALWPEVTDIPFFIRHPEGKGAGQTSDYYASTHDVAPHYPRLSGNRTAAANRRSGPLGVAGWPGPQTTPPPHLGLPQFCLGPGREVCHVQPRRWSTGQALRHTRRSVDEKRPRRSLPQGRKAYVRGVRPKGRRGTAAHLLTHECKIHLRADLQWLEISLL
jgi:arylsulfatase A-like enzyme